MMTRRMWFIASGFLSAVGLLLTGFVAKTHAQWSQTYRTIYRGAIAHSIVNKGMGGRRDNGKKQETHGFSYPQGRSLAVYSGGKERSGWNNKTNSCEGIWVMSKTGGAVKIAYAGTNTEPSDLVSLGHDVSTYPEAYLGGVYEGDWALSVHSDGGGRPAWTDAVNLAGANCNYWPASPDGLVPGRNTPAGHPVTIWNQYFNEYKRGAPFSERVAAGELPQLSPPAWAEALSEDDFPEHIGITKASSSLHNLQWTRKYYQFGHPDYDDFVINENVVENTGTETQEGVYVVLKHRIFSGAGMTWWQGSSAWYRVVGSRRSADDYTRSTLAANYLDGGAPLGTSKPAGSALGKQLADAGHPMAYCHDGDQLDPAWPHNDWGDPTLMKLAWTAIPRDQLWCVEGFWNHPGYFGVGLVDAFSPFNTYGGMDAETYVDPHDNPETTGVDESVQQPASLTIWNFYSHTQFDQPDPGKDGDGAIYDMLALGGYSDEPAENDLYSEFLTFGPYTLAPGEKCKVVVAVVGGMGSMNAKYSDYKKYAKPFEFAWMDMYNGPGKEPVDWQDRQAELPWGEEAMFNNFKNAIQAYDWGYDLPNQPPNIRLSKKSNLSGQNEISWSAYGEDQADPDYTGDEAKDIRGYRVYRGVLENQGPFELASEFSIADAKAGTLPPGITYQPDGVFAGVASSTYPDGVPLMSNRLVHGADPAAGTPVKGKYIYTDTQSRAGFGNYYFVRYYDSGHADWKGQGAVSVLESAPGTGGGGQAGRTGGVVPQVPSDDAFTKFQAQVAVVPNPYKADDPTRSYKGQQNIRFINLPGRCQIDIYDVMGQRVWTEFLNDLTTGEKTWIQLTENRPSNFGGTMYPGIYFWKVTNLMPEPDAGGTKWQFQTGTFLIMK